MILAMSEATEVVGAFIAAVESKDVAGALALVTDDIEYDNVPMPTAHGREETGAFLEQFGAMADEIQFVVHRQLADGDTVMNERTDRFRVGGRWLEIKVAGVFVVAGGQISLWRDYFDLQSFTDQMATLSEA
jgi:limonene-1,2-epoxide hydrolase